MPIMSTDDQMIAGRFEHVRCRMVALNETIHIMAEIDAVTEAHCGWPILVKRDAARPLRSRRPQGSFPPIHPAARPHQL
jgi:hypothetical protein